VTTLASAGKAVSPLYTYISKNYIVPYKARNFEKSQAQLFDDHEAKQK
jgi:hypothetical protein